MCEILQELPEVMQLEAWTLRETAIRIDDSAALREFVGIGGCGRMIDFTTLDKLFKAVEPETWEAINAGLAGWAVDSGAIDGSMMRIYTTVYETNIHYPSDSSLLWDSYRVLARWIEARIRSEQSVSGESHANRPPLEAYISSNP